LQNIEIALEPVDAVDQIADIGLLRMGRSASQDQSQDRRDYRMADNSQHLSELLTRRRPDAWFSLAEVGGQN